MFIRSFCFLRSSPFSIRTRQSRIRLSLRPPMEVFYFLRSVAPSLQRDDILLIQLDFSLRFLSLIGYLFSMYFSVLGHFLFFWASFYFLYSSCSLLEFLDHFQFLILFRVLSGPILRFWGQFQFFVRLNFWRRFSLLMMSFPIFETYVTSRVSSHFLISLLVSDWWYVSLDVSRKSLRSSSVSSSFDNFV